MSRILIIEDEKSIAELEKDYLQLSGFDVVVKNTGDEGMDVALAEEFDLIVLDLMLPGLDGFEVGKRIRQKKNTPIIIVSARNDDIDKIRGFGFGADDYITKPFSPNELVIRAKAHISRYKRLLAQKNEQNNIIHIRGLRIDKTDRRVTVDGVEKFLTAREYDLLVFLAEHPGRVYSKTKLFLEVWDLDGVGEEATVSVYIKKIRKKIEYDYENPQYIETVWGSGYRLRV